MKVVVLVSGGMDSVTALYDAYRSHEVVAGLSFDYGSKHNHCEIPFAKWHCENLGILHEIVDLEFMDALFASNLLNSGGEIPEGHYEEATMKQTVVPFRNGIMLAIAAGFAESSEAEGLVIATDPAAGSTIQLDYTLAWEDAWVLENSHILAVLTNADGEVLNCLDLPFNP